jgi:Myb-like DNA-binding domain
MEKETKRFNRVVISFEKSSDFPDFPPSVRSLKPVQMFSELKAIVDNFYPEVATVLVKPGTSEIVGSQDELLFAYQDIKDGEVLRLELKLFKSSKRKLASDKDIAPPSFRHEGPWSNGEIELFKMGVDQFGWRKWKSIAGVIGSRDREQVRQFSSTTKGINPVLLKGLSFKRSISITPGLLDLAEGMKTVAQSLQEQGVDREGE